MPSLLQEHFATWLNCRRCPLWRTRTHVVLCRGTSVPADVAFCGQAPGESEDSLGQPFVGPAGDLLQRRIIDRVLPEGVTYCLFNLVACLPHENGRKEHEPTPDSIHACAPRVKEFLALCRPKLLVCVGKLAEDWLEPGYKHSTNRDSTLPRVAVYHPSYILRMNTTTQRDHAVLQCVVRLRNAVRQYVAKESSCQK